MKDDCISSQVGDYYVEYQNAESFSHLPIEDCSQTYGVCFFKGQVVICRRRKGGYTLPGGSIEPGESLEQALAREVQEESNMRVLRMQPVGYQKVWKEDVKPYFQLRFYAQVEPYGDFESDPDEDIVGIELVSPERAEECLGWGEIGEELFRQAEFKHAQA